MQTSEISLFYHGVSGAVLFDGATIVLCGPVSTTTDFTIAWSIFGSNGIVLSIKKTKSAASFINANGWSSFANEDERLFVGGKQPISFQTIRNIPKRENFVIKGHLIQNMEPPLLSDVKKLRKLINSEMNCDYLQTP
eukprot:53707_1